MPCQTLVFRVLSILPLFPSSLLSLPFCLSLTLSLPCLCFSLLSSLFPLSASHSPGLSASSLPHPSIFYPSLLKPWTQRGCTNSTAAALPLHCHFQYFIRKPNSELPNDPKRRLSQFTITSKQHLRGGFVGPWRRGYHKASSAGPVQNHARCGSSSWLLAQPWGPAGICTGIAGFSLSFLLKN